MKRLLIAIAFLALATILSHTAAQGAERAATNIRPPRKKAATAASSQSSSYEKLLRGKNHRRVCGAGLALHLVDSKVYLELPDSLLNRAMLLTTRIEQTADSGEGIAGQTPTLPYLIEFIRGNSDSLLFMRECAPSLLIDGGDSMRRAVGQNYTGAITAGYTIRARTPDRQASLIDLTSLFVSDEAAIRPIDPKGSNTLGGWTTSRSVYKKERSRLCSVEAGRTGLSVLSELSYGTTLQLLGVLEICNDKPLSILTRRTLTPLGEPEPRMRLCDQRIGVMARSVRSYSEHGQGSQTNFFACRRSLTTRDGKRRPVIFYVDTCFDSTSYAAIEKGVLCWNEAFRRIGLDEVIQVRPMPSDPAFNNEFPLSNCIRRTGVSHSEFHTSSWIDRRSGEILGCEILIPFNYADAIHREQLLALGAADPQVRTLRPSARQTAEALTLLVARHTAATLGILPNFAASAAYPTDSLRSPSFTRTNGISASVTDDVFYNLVAQAGDKERGVRLLNDKLGPYDYLAVEWLYKPLATAATPQDEIPLLDSLLQPYGKDPRYRFLHYGARLYDPRVATGDLGSDRFRSLELQLTNLEYVATHADEWFTGCDPDFLSREKLLLALIDRLNNLSGQILQYIGGVYLDPAYEMNRTQAIQVVDRATQQRALKEVLDLSTRLGWLDKQAVSHNLFNKIHASSYIQDRILRNLFGRMEQLDFAASRSEASYTADQMANELADYFHRSLLKAEPLPEQMLSLQRALLKQVISHARVARNTSSQSKGSTQSFTQSEPLQFQLSGASTPLSSPEDGPANASSFNETIRLITASSVTEVSESLTDPASTAFYGFQKPRPFVPCREHLYFGLLLRLQEVYRHGASAAPQADTRLFCRFMADKIERALRID